MRWSSLIYIFKNLRWGIIRVIQTRKMDIDHRSAPYSIDARSNLVTWSSYLADLQLSKPKYYLVGSIPLKSTYRPKPHINSNIDDKNQTWKFSICIFCQPHILSDMVSICFTIIINGIHQNVTPKCKVLQQLSCYRLSRSFVYSCPTSLLDGSLVISSHTGLRRVISPSLQNQLQIILDIHQWGIPFQNRVLQAFGISIQAPNLPVCISQFPGIWGVFQNKPVHPTLLQSHTLSLAIWHQHTIKV